MGLNFINEFLYLISDEIRKTFFKTFFLYDLSLLVNFTSYRWQAFGTFFKIKWTKMHFAASCTRYKLFLEGKNVLTSVVLCVCVFVLIFFFKLENIVKGFMILFRGWILWVDWKNGFYVANSCERKLNCGPPFHLRGRLVMLDRRMWTQADWHASSWAWMAWTTFDFDSVLSFRTTFFLVHPTGA